MSISTTSARPAATICSAVVAPTLPAPMMVTLRRGRRAMRCSSGCDSTRGDVARNCTDDRSSVGEPSHGRQREVPRVAGGTAALSMYTAAAIRASARPRLWPAGGPAVAPDSSRRAAMSCDTPSCGPDRGMGTPVLASGRAASARASPPRIQHPAHRTALNRGGPGSDGTPGTPRPAPVPIDRTACHRPDPAARPCPALAGRRPAA